MVKFTKVVSIMIIITASTLNAGMGNDNAYLAGRQYIQNTSYNIGSMLKTQSPSEICQTLVSKSGINKEYYPDWVEGCVYALPKFHGVSKY